MFICSCTTNPCPKPSSGPFLVKSYPEFPILVSLCDCNRASWVRLRSPCRSLRFEASGLPGRLSEGCSAVDYFRSGCRCCLSQSFYSASFGLDLLYKTLGGEHVPGLARLSCSCSVSFYLFCNFPAVFPPQRYKKVSGLIHLCFRSLNLECSAARAHRRRLLQCSLCGLVRRAALNPSLEVPSASTLRSGAFYGFQSPFQVSGVYASGMGGSNQWTGSALFVYLPPWLN